MRDDGRLVGARKVAGAFFLAFVALALYWAYMQGWFASDTQSHSHDEANVELPASLAKHVKGSYTHGSMGSKVGIFGSTSWLQSGNKDDSKLVVKDTQSDGFTAVGHAYGCGREWYITDQNGFWNRAPGVRETNCNNIHHQAGRRQPNKTYWSEASWHRD